MLFIYFVCTNNKKKMLEFVQKNKNTIPPPSTLVTPQFVLVVCAFIQCAEKRNNTKQNTLCHQQQQQKPCKAGHKFDWIALVLLYNNIWGCLYGLLCCRWYRTMLNHKSYRTAGTVKFVLYTQRLLSAQGKSLLHIIIYISCTITHILYINLAHRVVIG